MHDSQKETKTIPDIKWQTPERVYINEYQKHIKPSFFLCVRITALGYLSLAAIRAAWIYFITPRFPFVTQIPWGVLAFMVTLMVGMIWLCYIVVPWIHTKPWMKKFRNTYSFSEKGIEGGSNTIFWKTIEAFDIETIPDVDGGQRLKLFCNSGNTRHISLPDNELADEIVAHIADHVTLANEDNKKKLIALNLVEVPIWLNIAFFIATIIYCIGVGYLFNRYGQLAGDWFELFVWGIYIYGPGSVVGVLRYGTKVRKQMYSKVQRYIIAYNLVGFLGTLISMLIFRIW